MSFFSNRTHQSSSRWLGWILGLGMLCQYNISFSWSKGKTISVQSIYKERAKMVICITCSLFFPSMTCHFIMFTYISWWGGGAIMYNPFVARVLCHFFTVKHSDNVWDVGRLVYLRCVHILYCNAAALLMYRLLIYRSSMQHTAPQVKIKVCCSAALQ